MATFKLSPLNTYAVLMQREKSLTSENVWDRGSVFAFGFDYSTQLKYEFAKSNIRSFKEAIMMYTFLDISHDDWADIDVIYHYDNPLLSVKDD